VAGSCRWGERTRDLGGRGRKRRRPVEGVELVGTAGLVAVVIGVSAGQREIRPEWSVEVVTEDLGA
jgi:hypothetical protein